MPKRFYVQRQHIIQSLDTFLYQLITLSFLLSPSLWLYICRIVSQFQCPKPRELDPNRSLRFFYTFVVLLNLSSLWNHSTQGAAEGRAIILDFIGMAYTPSKLQLFSLDIFIVSLQLLLATIAYETSVYHTTEESDAHDILLPEQSNANPLSIPLFNTQAGTPPDSPSSSSIPLPKVPAASGNNIPLVIDLRFQPIMTHLRHPPPPPRTRGLPLPNTMTWPLPGMNSFLRAGRQLRRSAATVGTRDMRVPGAMDTGPG